MTPKAIKTRNPVDEEALRPLSHPLTPAGAGDLHPTLSKEDFHDLLGRDAPNVFVPDSTELKKLAWTKFEHADAPRESLHPMARWRFDLNGALVGEGQRRGERELFHHGEEPDKAGYTIEELM